MSNEKQYEYGCEVCEHRSKCPPNPFGICRDFKRKEVTDEKRQITDKYSCE